MQALYTAASGMRNQQLRLGTIADNIANASTTGYKSTRVDFKDALYTQMDSPVADSAAANLLTGNGVLLAATTTDFADGALSETGNPFDFAIQGSGFFTVETAEGERYYTRNGCFNTSIEGENTYLVTAQGYYVLNAEGERIQLPEDTGSLSVTADGALSTTEGSFATLGIVEFVNPDGLEAVGGSCYRATEVSQEPAAATDSAVLQGRLELANVDLAQELTLLIRAQRAYSLASTALRTADDMEGLANNMR